MIRNHSEDILLRPGHPNAAKLIGQRFGRLIVIARSARKSPNKQNSQQAFWLCLCDCGNKITSSTTCLRKGHTRSCGCYSRERSSEIRKQQAAKVFGLHAQRSAYAVYVRNAKHRNYEFEISFDKFLDLSQEECYYCGVGPSNISRNFYNNGDFIYNGLDRVDNSKGYLIDNVVPCCNTCNIAKATMSAADFLAWIHRVAAKHPL